MDHADFVSAQRALRQSLFERGTVRWRPAQDLAARLLLYLDDPFRCWQETADWLRQALDADRVDGGHGGFVLSTDPARHYEPLIESVRSSLLLQSVLGARFDPADPGIRVVWRSPGPTVFDDVSQAPHMTPVLRGALTAVGTAAKLAVPLFDDGRPFGLLCADWTRPQPAWNADVCNQLADVARTVIAPILSTATRLAHGGVGPSNAMGAGLSLLTPAERKVAGLIAQGLSYKEIARQLDRSLSTIDHQLRSIRDKLGVSSTSRLVHLLNDGAATPRLN